MSSIRDTEGFKRHTSMFPIVVSVGRGKGEIVVDIESPIVRPLP